MWRCILAVCLTACLAPSTVSAQQMESASGAEIGTFFGLSHFNTDGEGVTLIGLPSAPVSSISGNPSIYICWFPHQRFSIGPEFSMGRTSGDGNSISSLYLSGRGAYHSGGDAASGAYILGRGALRVFNAAASGESETETDFGLGTGLGYRWRVGTGTIVRAEGGYRRWFDAGTNEFALLLGLGANAGGIAAATDRDTRISQTEIGTLFGLSRLGIDGGGTFIGLPSSLGSIVTGYPAIYVSRFLSERFSMGPEFSFGRTSVDGDAITSFYLAGRTAFHSGGVPTSGAYAFGRGAVRVLSSGSDSDTVVSMGAGLGYRWRVGPWFIVRTEGGYRRWFEDPPYNDFSVHIGLGANLGGS